MKISVIIPTYNRNDKLKKAFESVLKQKALPAEIIVVDDGSDVKASQILKGIKNWKTKIRIINQENKGVASARNRGIKESSFNWLAFLDSDDWWLPDKLLRQINFHSLNPHILISQTDEIWIRKGVRINQKKYHQKKSGLIFDISLERCMISPSSVMIHKDILNSVGTFDESFKVVEDYDLWLRITAKYPVGLINEKLIVKTGGHKDQLSQRYWGMDRFRVKALEKILNTHLEIDQRIAVIKKLLKKLKILADGSLKRCKESQAKYYSQKYDYYQNLLNDEKRD